MEQPRYPVWDDDDRKGEEVNANVLPSSRLYGCYRHAPFVPQEGEESSSAEREEPTDGSCDAPTVPESKIGAKRCALVRSGGGGRDSYSRVIGLGMLLTQHKW